MVTSHLKTVLNVCLLLFLNYLISQSALANKHKDKLNNHKTNAKLNLIAQHHDSQDTWLTDELGRYNLSSNSFLAELQLEYKYQLNQAVHFRTHIQAQQSTESLSSRSIGLVEWNVNFKKDIDWQQSVELTAGQFFLPISMENHEDFWESPYSIHFSSLNTWIGEEFRPIGLDAQYHYFTNNNNRITLAATVFGGNDSMGALLAYRGWSIGRHRTVLGDVVSLPDLAYLNGSGNFLNKETMALDRSEKN